MNETDRSRNQIQLLADDTKDEKFGSHIAFLHKLFDHCHDRYLMGYNYVMILVRSGDYIFPPAIMLWLPETHPDYRSKNKMLHDFIDQLALNCQQHDYDLNDVEILFDAAYAKEHVILSANTAGLRIVTKAGNTLKFEFEAQYLKPREIIEIIKERHWHELDGHRGYQRYIVTHRKYGKVVLVFRKRRLKNGKWAYDALLCNTLFYNAVRVDKKYRQRWDIEMHFKYYKQYLMLDKRSYRRVNTIKSHLYCIALAGWVVALFRVQSKQKISFRTAVKQITQELRW